jgi:hypothetical protein
VVAGQHRRAITHDRHLLEWPPPAGGARDPYQAGQLPDRRGVGCHPPEEVEAREPRGIVLPVHRVQRPAPHPLGQVGVEPQLGLDVEWAPAPVAGSEIEPLRG